MSRVRQKYRHLPVRLVIGFAVLLLIAWGALALWHQVLQPAVRLIALTLWAAAGLSMVVALTDLPGRTARNCSGLIQIDTSMRDNRPCLV